MIDLTPLDIRKKRGDFRKAVRGYDREEVDHFLELAAERLEEVVKENLAIKERMQRLEEQVQGQDNREKAVQEALVTAQNLRDDIKAQARREAEVVMREAQAAARGVRDEAERFLEERRRELGELGRMRSRFLKGLRTFLERELDAVEAEESNPPATDFDLEGHIAAPARTAPMPLDSLLHDDPEAHGEADDEARDDAEAAALETAPGGEAEPARPETSDGEGDEPFDPEEPGSRGHTSWEFDEHDRRDG